MAQSPIQIYNSAHARAEKFLRQGQSGKKDRDYLRAAVVFEAAAIDAYFRIKIIDTIKRKKEKKRYRHTEALLKLLRDRVALENFNKEYRNLNSSQSRIVDISIESPRFSFIPYVERALKNFSFLGIDNINSAIKMMGGVPQEVWGRFDRSTSKPKQLPTKRPGPKSKKGLGRKIDAKVQLRYLFEKRHLIVHESDVTLAGRARVGQPRAINYKSVKRWLESSCKSIKEINELI